MERFLPHAARAAAVVFALVSAGTAFAQRDAAAPPRGEQRTAEGLLARTSEGSFQPVKFDAGDAPFALRNNNWVSLKGPNLEGRWPGQTGANQQNFARFDDPAYAVRGFLELMRYYNDKHNTRSAAAIMTRFSPPGDCSGAPSVPAGERREGGNCPENEIDAPGQRSAGGTRGRLAADGRHAVVRPWRADQPPGPAAGPAGRGGDAGNRPEPLPAAAARRKLDRMPGG